MLIVNFANAILMDPRNAGNPKLEIYRPGGANLDKPYIRFIRDYLVAGQKCYVPEYIVEGFIPGIQMISEAGGIPVLAHPGEWFTTEDERKIGRMLECGLRGVEVYTPYHSEEQTLYFEDLAKQHHHLLRRARTIMISRRNRDMKWGKIEAGGMEMFRP